MVFSSASQDVKLAQRKWYSTTKRVMTAVHIRFRRVRDHLLLVKPDAAAAAPPFHKLRGPPVARLVATDVDCSVPPVRESAARYEPAAGHEPFLHAAAPRRRLEHAIARDTQPLFSYSPPTSVQPSVVLVSQVCWGT